MARMKKQMKQVPAAPAAVVPVRKRDPRILTAIAVLSVLIVGVLATDAYTRNAIYRTHVSLWKSVAESAPNKRRAHENYGQALSTAGSLIRNPEEASKLYYEALNQFNTVMALPDDGSVPMRDLYREIGVVQFRLNLFDDAISTWETGLKFAPYDPS